MEIKETQGQTLLTLLRVAIFAIAALSIFGMQNVADNVFDMIRTGISEAENAEKPAVSYGEPYILYYDEDLSGGDTSHIYRLYYITGEGTERGLVNAAGEELLPREYENIIVLPETYALKQDQQWQFYSRELEELSSRSWDDVQPLLSESGKINSDLIKVEKDGLFGAVDAEGSVQISARWEELELCPYSALWQLNRVKEDGSYGFVDADGDVQVSVRYDFALLSQYTVTDEEGNQATAPVIYVYDDEDWGAIYPNRYNEPGSVDWDAEPSEAATAAYAELQQ